MRPMHFDRGSLSIGRAHGAPIEIHWSVLAIIALEAIARRSALLPVCFAAALLLHELAHAGAVRSLGGRVVRIQVHFLGGICEGEGWLDRRAVALIAGAGPLANLIGFGAATALLRPGLPGWLHGALSTASAVNLVLAVVNLLPIAPLDGATFWREFRPVSFRDPPPRRPESPRPRAPGTPTASARRGGLRALPRDDQDLEHDEPQPAQGRPLGGR